MMNRRSKIKRSKRGHRNNKQQTPDILEDTVRSNPIMIMSDMILMGISPITIDSLPNMIKRCIKDKIPLLVYSSEGDNTSLELSQIPHIKRLFVKAVIEYGLLGFMISNHNLYPNDEYQRLTDDIIITTLGYISSSDGIDCSYSLDKRAVDNLIKLSLERYIEIY